MSKDPAFLFYTQDFQTGTQFFTDEQVGKYIRLLSAQHQHGRLTEKHMLFICKTYDKDIWKKFVKDADGNYYNERLEMEVNKRKTYSESRRNNRIKAVSKGKTPKKSPKNISKTYVEHMENENDHVNEIKKEDEKPFGKSENIFVLPKMFELFKKHNPKYPGNKDLDYKPLLKIRDFLFQQGNSPPDEEILQAWETIAQVVSQDNFYKQKTLSTISNCIQEITQIALHGKQSTSKNERKPIDEDKLKEKLSEHLRAREQI